MKIFSSEQIKAWDAYTIAKEPISSINLMERAASGFVYWYINHFDKNRTVKVFCGPGNNGGDGLAISRLLNEKGYHVETWVVVSEKYSEDFKTNEQRLKKIQEVHYIKNAAEIPFPESTDIIIDALFGSGLTRPVSGLYAEVIQRINHSEAQVVSVDVPSGMFCETLNDDPYIIQADYTVTFQLPKLSFLLAQNEKFTGHLEIIEIGLSEDFLEKTDSEYYFTQKRTIKRLLKKRNKFSHKGTYGTALLIGGSYGMMGASVLMSRACLKTGVGLCVSYVPECGYSVLQTAVPESMVLTDSDANFITEIPPLEKYSAIGVGPGLGKAAASVRAVMDLLEKAQVPLVIDADALNILSEHPELLEKIPAGAVLTPHPKEFQRLAGTAQNDYQRLTMLKDFAVKCKSIVILKGAYTAIAAPDGKIYFNSTGNPGMATGGSGDVLTGIITSLIAQGYSPLKAAVLGVYMHGYAGDAAAEKLSQPSLIASDIVDNIPAFYKDHL